MLRRLWSMVSARDEDAAVAPLASWLAVQLAAMAMAAWGVPLCRNFPYPPTRVAIHEMLTMQIAASAMLMPWLLRSWRSVALCIAAALPMIQLAGFLSAVEQARITAVMVYLAAWLAGLGVWMQICRSHKTQLIASAVATVWAVGGPVLWYLEAERAGGAVQSDQPLLLAGPIMCGFAVLEGHTGSAWALAGTLLVAGLMALAGIWIARQFFHRISTGQEAPDPRCAVGGRDSLT